MIKNDLDTKHYILNFYENSISLMKMRVGIYAMVLLCLLGLNIMLANFDLNYLLLVFTITLLIITLVDSYFFMRKVKFYKYFINKITEENHRDILQAFNRAYNSNNN